MILQKDEDAGFERWELELPHVDAGAHLADYLFDVGPAEGGEVLTFQEIEAWGRATGIVLDAWESETLRRLSAAYLAERMDAADEHRPPPTMGEIERPAADVASKLASILDQFERQDAQMGVGEKAARAEPTVPEPSKPRRGSSQGSAGRVLRAPRPSPDSSQP